jgi:hypothetical protein
MRIHTLFALLAWLVAAPVLADPTCAVGMLRGLYAFQGDGSKLVSAVAKNAAISGTVNVLPASVQVVVSTSTFGSTVTNTDRFTGTLTVGSRIFTASVTAAEQLNCLGVITLDTKNNVTQTPPVKLRLVVKDGGNGFYLFNAATDELWTAEAEKS